MDHWAPVLLILLFGAGFLLVLANTQSPGVMNGLWPPAISLSGEGAVGPAAAAQVVLFVSPTPLMQGQSARAQAMVSGCLPDGGQMALDDQPLPARWNSDESALVADLPPLAGGTHRLAYTSAQADCQSNLSFVVSAPQCNVDDTRPCSAGGCPGSVFCLNGKWSTCQASQRICMPGQRVSCSTSGCSFGLAQCDECGSGWLDCKPPSSYN